MGNWQVKLGKMAEHPKSKSTQPRFARRCTSLNFDCLPDESVLGQDAHRGERDVRAVAGVGERLVTPPERLLVPHPLRLWKQNKLIIIMKLKTLIKQNSSHLKMSQMMERLKNTPNSGYMDHICPG